MFRQAGAVLSVALGRDCGWKSGDGNGWRLRPGLAEAVAGWVFLALAILLSGAAAAWLAPIALGLCFAPLVMRILDAPV
jgi:membrane glycosyltransferase